MKTIFDQSTREELINRINTLSENSMAQWGKMNVFQMLKHCTFWDEWILGKNNPTYKQSWLGVVFGKLALKGLMKDDRPIKRNMPTGAGFIPKEKSGKVDPQKKKWTELIAEYAHFANPDFVHDFFGKMTKEQIGILVYKHADHHLRQFNC